MHITHSKKRKPVIVGKQFSNGASMQAPGGQWLSFSTSARDEETQAYATVWFDRAEAIAFAKYVNEQLEKGH